MPFIQFRIHPSVGIARMGNSHNAYFLASDFPQFLQELYPKLRHKPRPLQHPLPPPTPSGLTVSDHKKAHEDKYRDDDNLILPQAARFRVFAYVYDTATDHTPSQVFEVGPDDADIEWEVELANLKSVTTVAGVLQVVDNKPSKQKLETKTAVAGPAINVAPSATSAIKLKTGTQITLGVAALELDPTDKTKITNRLLLIGNEGEIRRNGGPSIRDGGLFKENWRDAAADGSVTAKILPKDPLKTRFSGAKYYTHNVKNALEEAAATSVEAVPAWAVVALPDYVPDSGHLISLWDLALSQGLWMVTNKKAKDVDTLHKMFTKSSEMLQYKHTDYFAHIHPLLTLFKDLTMMSNQVRSASDTQTSADISGTISTGPATAAASVTVDQTLADMIAIAARFHPSRPPAANVDPFVIVLTDAASANLTGGRHEYVQCTSITSGNVLNISRAHGPSPTALDWSAGSVRFVARAPYRVHECELGTAHTSASTTLTVPMSDARMLVAPEIGTSFLMKIVEGAKIEWVECTANSSVRAISSLTTAALTVTRGRNGTSAQAFGPSAKLVGLAIGHKELTVRTNRAQPKERRNDIWKRLRLPDTLYVNDGIRRTFKSNKGLVSKYPRPFGRRMDNDPDLSNIHFPDTNVDQFPRGSLTRFLTVLTGAGKSCKANASVKSGISLPLLTGEEQPFLNAIDDFYWAVTERDMPMLKDYAFTREQYQHFNLWANHKNNVWNGTFVFDDPDSVKSVLSAFFNEEHTADEYFKHLAAKKSRFAPALLDIANLGMMLGGSFMPGIEVGREGGVPQNWSLYHGGTACYPDVRFWPQGEGTAHEAGRLSKDLAIPWQGDFVACNETFWPTSRPQIVRSPGGSTYPWLERARHFANDADFESYWVKLGFIRRSGPDNDPVFVEQEALFSRP